MRERLAQAHRRRALGVLEVARPVAGERPRARVEQRRRREPARIERVAVDERLERGPGLAVRLRRAIERSRRSLVASDERQDLARAHVERDHRSLGPDLEPKRHLRTGRRIDRREKAHAHERSIGRELARRQVLRVVPLVIGQFDTARRGSNADVERALRIVRGDDDTHEHLVIGELRRSLEGLVARLRFLLGRAGDGGRRERA